MHFFKFKSNQDHTILTTNQHSTNTAKCMVPSSNRQNMEFEIQIQNLDNFLNIKCGGIKCIATWKFYKETEYLMKQWLEGMYFICIMIVGENMQMDNIGLITSPKYAILVYKWRE